MPKHKTNNHFFNLDPKYILKHIEDLGFQATGEIFQLNSYENRVFEIKLENHEPLIVKYYRPHRWSLETIQDEHDFGMQLQTAGLNVGIPISFNQNSKTIHTWNHQDQKIHYAYFKKVRGRMMQEILHNEFEKIGSYVALIHNVGQQSVAKNRNYLGPTGESKWNIIQELEEIVSLEVKNKYLDLIIEIFDTIDEKLSEFNDIRIHGDLHRGNILKNSDDNLAFVDLDDMINGPAVQDFWMLFPDQNFIETKEFELFLNGYQKLREFNLKELELIHLLRSYRQINYSYWIYQRWDDPSFKKLFPEFNTYRYWVEETEALQKCLF